MRQTRVGKFFSDIRKTRKKERKKIERKRKRERKNESKKERKKERKKRKKERKEEGKKKENGCVVMFEEGFLVFEEIFIYTVCCEFFLPICF